MPFLLKAHGPLKSISRIYCSAGAVVDLPIGRVGACLKISF